MGIKEADKYVIVNRQSGVHCGIDSCQGSLVALKFSGIFRYEIDRSNMSLD